MTDDKLPDDFNLNRKEVSDIISAVGGAGGVTNGEWYLRLVRRALEAYGSNANAEYFRSKYSKSSSDKIAKRLIRLASANAALVGTVSGATMTASELSAVVSGGSSLIIAGPAAALGIGVEMIGTTWIQLKLIAALAALYGPPLDPDDPEDVLLAIYFFAGSMVSDAVHAASKKTGMAAAKVFVRAYISGNRLRAIQIIGKKIGLKILQRTLRNVLVPVVSIGVGGVWNFAATRKIGSVAQKVMKDRGGELAGDAT